MSTAPALATLVAADTIGRLNLTDIWKQVSSPYQQRPAAWFALASTDKYLDATAKKLKVAKSDLLKTKSGRGGGSFAHKLVALEYARYLSPKLAVAVNEVFFERVAEEKDPSLTTKRAIEGYRKLGMNEAEIAVRMQGVQARNYLTGIAARHGVRDGGYRDLTNAIYMPLLGGTAAQVRQRENLPENANIRNSRSLLQLRAIEFAELLGAENIEAKKVFGNEACVNECYRAAVEVKNAVLRSRA